MGVSGNSIAGKSFQSFAVSDELLAKVTEAVQAGEKKARSTSTIQSFEVFYRGFRQNIAIGRIYIIPPSVCNDRKDFPTALLYGCLVKEFGGEEVGDMVEKKIGESEFDEYSQADFDTIREKLFGVEDGKLECLVLYAPSWWNKREYITFKFTSDEDKLKNNLRHQVFAAYYDPRLSSAFNALMTNVNTTKVDVTDITPKMQFPALTQGLDKAYPELQKQAGTKKRVAFMHHNADELAKEVFDPQEMDVFESLDQALTEAILPGTETVEEAAEPDQGGFNTPDTQHEVPRLASTEKEAAGMFQNCPMCHGNKGCDNCGGSGQVYDANPTINDQKMQSTPLHQRPDNFTQMAAKKIASAKLAGKEFKTARVNLTFGTESVYFDMGGKKYMLKGDAAAQFIDEWLPMYRQMKGEFDAERDRVVDKLCQKYMGKMEKRPEKPMKSPAPSKITVDPSVNEEQPEAMSTTASSEYKGWKITYMGGTFYGKKNGVRVNADSEKALKEVIDNHIKDNRPPWSGADANKKADWNTFTPDQKKDNVHPGNLKDADVIAAIDEKKWGTATIPINFGKREAGIPTFKSASAADYIAEHIAMEIEDNSEVISVKAKKARDEREARLAANRRKQADVPLDLDSIWNDLTEEMGPAPQIDLPGEGGDNSDSSEGGNGAKPEGGSSDGRPRKSDVGKLPEAFKEKKEETPEPKKEEPKQENSTPKPQPKKEEKEDEGEDEKWHVSSSMDDFVKEAFEDLTDEVPTNPDNDFFEENGHHFDGIHDYCLHCGVSQTDETADRPCPGVGFAPENEDDYYPGQGQGLFASVAEDVAEAKAEVVSPDTVDSTIHQETKSVEEAAKVSAFGLPPAFNKETYQSFVDLLDQLEQTRNVELLGQGDALAKATGFTKQWQGVREALQMRNIEPEALSGAIVSLRRALKHSLMKYGSDVKSDVSEAKAQVVSPDTVDTTIHQETKSVEEAAKIGSDVNSDLSEAKSELDHGAKSELADTDATKTVNPEHFAAAPIPMSDDFGEVPEDESEISTMEADNGTCPHCHSIDTESVEAEEGTHLYCFSCDQVTKLASKTAGFWNSTVETPANVDYRFLEDPKSCEHDPDALYSVSPDAYPGRNPKRLPTMDEQEAKMAASGDDMPEEVPFDFGAGDLADVVTYEETDGESEK